MAYRVPDSTGGGQPHNHGNTDSAKTTQSVVQPYVVVAKWIRTT